MKYEQLGEQYQPIWGIDSAIPTSRACHDRATDMQRIVDVLERTLGRKLRILDLGASQGYFTVHFAKLGHSVDAVEYDELNAKFLVDLVSYHGLENLVNIHSTEITQFVKTIDQDYDIVFCLSVLHHVYHFIGSNKAVDLLNWIATHSEISFFELARREEDYMYWSKSLPRNMWRDFIDFAFFHELKTYENHLGEHPRPLFFASSNFFYENNNLIPKEQVQFFTTKIEDDNSCNRRVFKVGQRLFKIQLTSSGFTNEARLEFELLNSNSLQGFFKVFGACCLHCDGKFVTTISRDFLAGITLDTLTPHDSRDSILVGFIQMVEALSKIGLSHNDLRPWNLVWDGKRVQPLDLGSISETANDANSIPQSIVIVANAYLILNPNSQLDFSRINRKQLRKLKHFASSSFTETDLIMLKKIDDDIRNYATNSFILKRFLYRLRVFLSKIKALVV
jgi:O-antigen chain-terminating methyltransferase